MQRTPRAAAVALLIAGSASALPFVVTGGLDRGAGAVATPLPGTIDRPADPVLQTEVARLAGGNASGDSAVAVEVLHDQRDHAVIGIVEALGGRVTGTAPGSIVQATIGVDRLAALSRARDVQFLRSPRAVSVRPHAAGRPDAGPITAEAIGITAAGQWHAAGFTGSGAKVGIIDYFNGTTWDAQVASGEVPAAAGTFCQDSVPDGFDDCPGGSVFSPAEAGHGNAVAEIIHDIAPTAQLYLGRGGSISDMYAVVDWFVANGVRVINRSLGSPYDGPGDGTGSLDGLADYAVAKGITWINSAGNEGYRQYWRGPWADRDGDGWLEFAPGDETLAIDTSGSSGCLDILGFRWSDWGAAATRTDYDVYIYEGDVPSYPNDTTVFPPNQQQGAPPIELDGVTNFDGVGCSQLVQPNIRVRRRSPGSGSTGDVLELLMYSGEIEHSQTGYSAGTGIVDSKNRGVIAVGAVDPATSGSIGYYSSQGPTNDGRIKPDLSAPSGISTSVFGPDGFRGTSGAAPVVTGLAAVLVGARQAQSPQGLAALLKHHVVDRGATGPDNAYGAGQVLLPAPVTVPLDASPAAYTPITPTRLLDTRPSGTPLWPEQILDVPVAPLVPAGATGVAMNVTVVGAARASYVQVFPTGLAMVDESSNLNVESVGQILPNFVISPVGANGSVSIYSPTGGHLLIDVLGYFVPTEPTAAGRLVPIDPVRVLDTRQNVATTPSLLPPGWTNHRPGAGEVVPVHFRAPSGLPATGVSAVVLTVTGTSATANGFVTAYPSVTTRPNASVLNLVTGDTNANTIIVPLGLDRTVSLFTERGAHLIVDLAGYITDAAAPVTGAGRFVPLPPSRVKDSRGSDPLASNVVLTVPVVGPPGLPASGVGAVSLNFTATQTQGSDGYLQAWPNQAALVPSFSNLNWTRVGQTIASGGIVKLGASNSIDVRVSQSTHIAIDVNGYFTG